jgi:hypothetical protein
LSIDGQRAGMLGAEARRERQKVRAQGGRLGSALSQAPPPRRTRQSWAPNPFAMVRSGYWRHRSAERY